VTQFEHIVSKFLPKEASANKAGAERDIEEAKLDHDFNPNNLSSCFIQPLSNSRYFYGQVYDNLQRDVCEVKNAITDSG
jgi:hypothetical protein